MNIGCQHTLEDTAVSLVEGTLLRWLGKPEEHHHLPPHFGVFSPLQCLFPCRGLQFERVPGPLAQAHIRHILALWQVHHRHHVVTPLRLADPKTDQTETTTVGDPYVSLPRADGPKKKIQTF